MNSRASSPAVAGVPGKRQNRPVSRTRSISSRRRAKSCPCRKTPPAGFRLCRAHRCRQPCGGRARRPAAGAAAHQAAERPDRGNHHRAIGQSQSAVAGIRGDVQGAHLDTPLPEAHRTRRRRQPRPPHARPRAGDAGHIARQRLGRTICSSSSTENRYPRLEVLLADIALGNRMPDQVARCRCSRTSSSLLDRRAAVPAHHEEILINGSERGVLTFSTCCYPIPGDDIMGYLTAGKGVVVHRIDCPNVNEYRKRPERWVPIAWDRKGRGRFPGRAALRNRKQARRPGQGGGGGGRVQFQHRFGQLPRARRARCR